METIAWILCENNLSRILCVRLTCSELDIMHFYNHWIYILYIYTISYDILRGCNNTCISCWDYGFKRDASGVFQKTCANTADT